MATPKAVRELPIVTHIQNQMYKEFGTEQGIVTLDYSSPDDLWHRLELSLPEAMRLLALLKGLQLDLGFPIADDPRSDPNPRDTSTFHSDSWVQANSPVEAEKLHALGLVTLRWNSCELGLRLIFASIFGLKFTSAWAITQGMGNIAICNAIKERLNQPNENSTIKPEVIYALEIFDTNRINRNQLTHFLPSGSAEGMTFMRARGTSFDPQPFPDTLNHVRKVAEDLKGLSTFLSGLANWLVALSYGKQPGTLPERPSRPDKLWDPASQRASK